MKIKLAYSKQGLIIDLPDEWNTTVIEPTFVSGIPKPNDALRNALRNPISSHPLKDIVSSDDRVGIVFSDITRPTPHHLILPAVLKELECLPAENVTLFNALGTHRSNTDKELRAMLGEELVANYRIIQNDARDLSTHIYLGRSSWDHEIWLNRELYDCDRIILTGFIEPHFFAGFSGGGKAIMPGMAGETTILSNHDARMIAHPNATWGITKGNPIWEEMYEIAMKVKNTFLVNVALNKHKEITGVFAGDLSVAHSEGCKFVLKTAMVPAYHPFDIVVTTNSGYPLDINLYQSVKGMSAAYQVVRKGGSIIIATECWDGIPDHGLYNQLLKKAHNPHQLLDAICAPGFLKQDQWQAQIQAQIQLNADVYVHSSHLSDEQIRNALLKPCHSIVETLAELLNIYGLEAEICILPEGPQTIPYLVMEDTIKLDQI